MSPEMRVGNLILMVVFFLILLTGCMVENEPNNLDSFQNENSEMLNGTTDSIAPLPDSQSETTTVQKNNSEENEQNEQVSLISEDNHTEVAETIPVTIENQLEENEIDPEDEIILPDSDNSISNSPFVDGDDGFFNPKSSLINPGMVAIYLDKSQFSMGEDITISIVNGHAQFIYTNDLKSGCTVVILEKWNGDSWKDITGCNMDRLALTIPIEPDQGFRISLNPSSTHFQFDDDNLMDGIKYRFRFAYKFVQGDGPDTEAVYSQEFSINHE